MDKQKQIEEMAMKLIIADDLCRRAKDCDACKYNYIVDSNLCEKMLIAEELLKYYQPKIPEGAVVLTREEYERWQGQTLNIKKVRKETAKLFAERLKEMAYQSTDWSHGEHPMVVEVDYIDEIAKEITEASDVKTSKS